MDYILFIDTNVLLDFYRARNDTSLHLLERIDQNHDKIITTYQVEMEFKKNRQAAIISALDELRKPDFKGSVPAFFKEAKTVASIERSEKQIKEKVKKLRERTKRLLANPTTNDPVYKSIQRLFRDDTPFNLSRTKDERFRIRRLAWKRFILGYPPRKSGDTSTGDAVNWEWIIECASRGKKHVIVASRDSDYGVTIDGQSYLNDWLLQEYRARVSKKGRAVLTQKLTEALKLMTVKVTKEEEREEEKLIHQRGAPQQTVRRFLVDPDSTAWWSELKVGHVAFGKAWRVIAPRTADKSDESRDNPDPDDAAADGGPDEPRDTW